jgi:hypothetical protein|tara:strand:- start:113 stop:436 length:324 start_codon:yes stop_codon:yes gene_type:complete
MSQPNVFGYPTMDHKKVDPVNKPRHYNRNGIEAIDAIEASMTEMEFFGYLKGNVEKYLWRYGYKEKPIEDLKKARWYLTRLIDRASSIGDVEIVKQFKKLETKLAEE